MYDPEMRKDCPMRGNLGNCSPVGGFCVDAVSDEICEAVHNAYRHGYGDALIRLKDQETVVAHWDDDTGHWIEGDRNGIDPHTRTTGEMIDTFSCSWCGFYQYWKTPFCPNCGAKMEGR